MKIKKLFATYSRQDMNLLQCNREHVCNKCIKLCTFLSCDYQQMERCASIGGGVEKHLRSCRTSPHFSNLNGVTYTGRKLFDQCKTRYLNIVRCNYCLQATGAAIARLKIFTFTKVCFWGLKRAHGYAPITLPYHEAVIFSSALRYLHKGLLLQCNILEPLPLRMRSHPLMEGKGLHKEL